MLEMYKMQLWFGAGCGVESICVFALVVNEAVAYDGGRFKASQTVV